jgi:hypothetical protein
MTDANPPAITEPSYAYRPSVLGATWNLRLTPEAILWDAGRRSGRVPYDQVTGVRMSFRPATLQNQRFLTEIWSRDGTKLQIASTSWKSMAVLERFDDGYRGFIGELHRRLIAAGTRAVFVRGRNPPLYWAGLSVFVASSLAIAVLIARSAQAGATGAALMVGFFLIAFLWQASNYFRRNWPGRYLASALPPDLLPAQR